MAENTLDDFKRYKIASLKAFLRARGQKTSLPRASLEALCFGCSVLGIEEKPSSVEEERARAKQYEELLETPDGPQPDPWQLEEWLDQKSGLQSWPQITEIDIGTFLLSVYDPGFRDLGKRMLSDYKEGKAFSYTEKWLSDIYYHPISDNAKYCFLRGESIPSMNINNTPHKMWVMVEKARGCVQSAYCTCFAGYLQM